MTVRGDSSPRSNAVRERDSQIDIIDLDSFNDVLGLNQDDFMTDEEFEATFGQNVHTVHDRNTRLQQESILTHLRILDSFSINGNTYRKGKTVELESGDFLRISDVLEDRRNKAVWLRGKRFRRTSRFQGLFDQHVNEVVMLVEYMEQKPLEEGELELATVLLSDVVKIRELILTNEAYPTFSFKENKHDIGLPRATVRESCRIVCRWKVVITYRIKTTHKACVEMSVIRLRTEESDHKYRARDKHLREEWRGVTNLGGSCPKWLQDEKQFEIHEQKLNHGVNTPGFRSDNLASIRDDTIDLTIDTISHPNKQRYTFGDAFCGAGGASRGAKSAGYRVDWGFDFDPAPIESYRRNFFAARCEATPAHVFVIYIQENYIVDVLHLSPPCKTFSPLHTRPGRDDDMNSASFFAVEELLRKTKPRIVTMENTFGLVERWRDWLNSMVRFFTSLGFSVRWKVLNLAEYGLPQARRRLIVFASW